MESISRRFVTSALVLLLSSGLMTAACGDDGDASGGGAPDAGSDAPHVGSGGAGGGGLFSSGGTAIGTGGSFFPTGGAGFGTGGTGGLAAGGASGAASGGASGSGGDADAGPPEGGMSDPDATDDGSTPDDDSGVPDGGGEDVASNDADATSGEGDGGADASAECGNDIVEDGETCDGDCPTQASCTDTNACTTHTYTGSVAMCTAVCEVETITACTNGDNCCPDDCNANNDNNCDPDCGNDVVENGEVCDGNCPTTCPAQACKTATLTGSAAACTAECIYADVACGNGDQCCPTGCTSANDNDCSPTGPVCGNDVVETGEDCDPPSPTSDPVCSERCLLPVNECLWQAENERGQDPNTCDVECNCQNCTDELDACFNATDTTSGGASKAELCADVVLCGQETGCRGTACLCGTASAIECLFGGANGPCRNEIYAAAGTTSVVDILALQGDLNSPIGRASAVSNCAENNCDGACE